jgi:type IV pilus assembly protein PilC
METYRYIGEDSQGQRVDGQIEATGREEAERLLRERGLIVHELSAATPLVANEPMEAAALSRTSADEVAEQIARVSTSNLPMADGLRAAADETRNRRVASALRQLASRMDQGETLENILSGPGELLPRPLSGLILAASRTGQLGSALVELSDQQRASRGLRRDMVTAFAYPVTVLALAAFLFAFAVIFVGGAFERVYDDFGLQLPAMTVMLLWWRSTGIWIALGLIVVGVCVVAVYRLFAGKSQWLRLVSTIPLFGPLVYWSGVTDWSGLLSVLLRHEVPLPDALRFAGHGIRNAHIGSLSIRLADGVARGRTISEMIAATRQLPTTLVPMIRWGETAGALSESFAVSQTVFEKRVRTRTLLLQTLLPPILFVMIGCCAAFLVFGLFFPLVSLISSLS